MYVSSWLFVSILLECCRQLFDLTGSNVFLPSQGKASFSLYLSFSCTTHTTHCYHIYQQHLSVNLMSHQHLQSIPMYSSYLKHISITSISVLLVFSITSTFRLLGTATGALSIVEIPCRPLKTFRKSSLDSPVIPLAWSKLSKF